MYCPECGAEIPGDSKYCSECGANISTDEADGGGEWTTDITGSDETGPPGDWDFIMSIQDGFERIRNARVLIDLGILLASAGFWFGLMAVEHIKHHYELKKGRREPFEEGDPKQWHLF